LFLNWRIGVWRRRGEAASASLSAAPCFAHHKLYSDAVVSSIASTVALAEAGQFKEAVQYLQKAAKTLFGAAREVFEQVKVTVQRLVELFVEAITRVLAWIDEHKAYLFLMASGVVALNMALDMWGLVELEKLAYAASLTPFIPAGVKEYSREEVFNILKNDTNPYERFKEIAKEANVGRVKLAEPWESLRVLIMPKSSEERDLMRGRGAGLYSKYLKDENYKRALFYATLALEEAFSVYRTALRKYAEGLREAVQVGEEPFKRDMYVADLEKIKQLTEKEDEAFEKALRVLKVRLNEYAVKYNLRDLLDVNEDIARRLAEAGSKELSKFSDVNFGVKAYAALVAYREYALGRRSVFGKAAGYWLEVGGSAWLIYYALSTAYNRAMKAEVERPAAVEEMVAEALRRLFLKPGADHLYSFVEELKKGGKLALELERGGESSYVFRLFRLEEDRPEELGIKLRIAKAGESITYAMTFDDVERWRVFFGQGLEAGVKAAGEVKERLPVEDRLLYMLGWVDSDVAISGGLLHMGTTHLWQLAETHALFDWSDIEVRGVSLTLEGPKPQFHAYTSLEKLDDAIKKSAEGGWLNMLGTKAGLEDFMHVKSWEGLKRWVAEHWDVVVEAAVRRLGEGVRGELEALRNKLNDDKVAREVVGPALLLIQAERLGVNEETLRYFAAVVSGAIDGDGYVSAAMGKVGLTSGERGIALLWAAALAAHGFRTIVEKAGSASQVIVSDSDAVKPAGLYFLYGSPLLEGDDRLKSHKLTEAMELGAGGLSVSWEGLRGTKKDHVAADLTISVSGAAVKYNVYLHEHDVSLEFQSTDRSRVELAARLLRLAGVSAEVRKAEVGGRDVWYVKATTDRLAAGREELRKALAEIVETARKSVGEEKAKRWLEKLEKGLTLREGWPKYHVGLSSNGALEVRYHSTNPKGIEQEAQRFRDMGLKEGVHFTVKMLEGDKAGYVSILREGLAYAAWLSVRGKDKQQRELAREFVELILQRAGEVDKDVCGKALEVVEEGKAWGSQKLERFEKKVEVNGKTYVVKVTGWGAEIEESQNGKKLLRIRITAEVGRVEGEHIVDRVVREYTITFGRCGADNAAKGSAAARADAPGGREADAERFSALIKALAGEEPGVYHMKDGRIIIKCYRKHLDGFARYAELTGTIIKWLEETDR
jgi:hypothetical protein